MNCPCALVASMFMNIRRQLLASMEGAREDHLALAALHT
jgi:hypothetical protein